MFGIDSQTLVKSFTLFLNQITNFSECSICFFFSISGRSFQTVIENLTIFSIQKKKNWSKLLPNELELIKIDETCQTYFRFVHVSSELSKLVQNCSKWMKCVQIGSKSKTFIDTILI